MCTVRFSIVLVVVIAVCTYFGRQASINIGGPHDFSFYTAPADVVRTFDADLSGKNVLVTGARRGGIGFETARALVSVSIALCELGEALTRVQVGIGARVFAHTRTEEQASTTAKELGGKTVGVAADLSDLNQVKSLADKIVKELNGEPLHIFIANAGGYCNTWLLFVFHC